MSLALDVLRRFDREGIAYCHWKSNDHLEAALAANTDLDILVDPGAIDGAYRIFSEMSFRRARVAAARNDPGLEDFIGFDDQLGRLVHFHVHYRVVSGERHYKRFRLPWEREILDTRVLDESGAWVTAPAMEAVLLLTRYSLKLRGRDIVRGLKARRGGGATPTAELAFLMARTDTEHVCDIAARLLGNDGRDAVSACLKDGCDIGRLLRLRRIVLRRFRSQTATRGVHAQTIRMGREFAWLRRGISRKVAPRPVLLGRGGGGGGLLIAFIGSDGSGKSTMVKKSREFLSAKLDVYPMYLGSGDGSASLLRRPMKWARDRVFGGARSTGAAERKDVASSDHPRAMSLAKVVWALTLSAEKSRKITRVMRARTRGMVVICDRWPQCQYPGELDGPRLSEWNNGSWFARKLAAYERRPYALAEQFPPDLIVLLDVDVATASQRRPTDSMEYLERRIAMVRELNFSGSLFGTVRLDASRPEHDVLNDVLHAILSRL